MYINTDEKEEKNNKDNSNGTCFTGTAAPNSTFHQPNFFFSCRHNTLTHTPNSQINRHIGEMILAGESDRYARARARTIIRNNFNQNYHHFAHFLYNTHRILASIFHISAHFVFYFRLTFYCFFFSYRYETSTMSLAKFDTTTELSSPFFHSRLNKNKKKITCQRHCSTINQLSNLCYDATTHIKNHFHFHLILE